MPSVKYDYTENFRNCQSRSMFFIHWNRQLSQDFKCTLCNNVLIEPIQTECGCRFCYNCIENYINHSNTICPNCELKINRNNFTRDKAVEKEIFNHQIKCPNEKCVEIFLLKELKNHIKICQYRIEQCDQCQQSYQYKFKEQHASELCGQRIVTCGDCQQQMSSNDYENKHRNIEMEIDNLCDNWIDKCPQKCSNDDKFVIKMHLKECPNNQIDCPLNDIGCTTRDSVNGINQHLEIESYQHQIFLVNEIVRLKTENDDWKQSLESANQSLHEEVQSVKELNKELLKFVENLQKHLCDNDTIIANMKLEMEKQKQLIDNSSLHCENQLSLVSGELIWNIENIRQKINDAKSGNQLQIISESFYISRPGYRLRLKVYPNGDGRGKDKYLSVYFMIVQGEYDNEISWPFRQKVSLSILSSKSARHDIMINMKPDNNVACYGKPINEFNVGAGQPEFIKLSELLTAFDYIHGTSIKLGIRVQSMS